jgi:hypothetical protein
MRVARRNLRGSIIDDDIPFTALSFCTTAAVRSTSQEAERHSSPEPQRPFSNLSNTCAKGEVEHERSFERKPYCQRAGICNICSSPWDEEYQRKESWNDRHAFKLHYVHEELLEVFRMRARVEAYGVASRDRAEKFIGIK